MSTPRTRAQPPPIALRAAITEEEWVSLRKMSIDLNVPTQSLVADALRAAYPLTPKEDPPA